MTKKGIDVVTVGDVNIDIITEPLSPDLVNQKDVEIASRLTITLGGNAGNAAMALSHLGLKTRLIGALSDDPNSHWLIDQLTSHQIDYQNCFKKTPAAITIALTYKDGSRTFLSDFGSNALLSPEDIDFHLIQGRHLLRAGYWWAPRMMGTGTRQLFQFAKEKQMTTSLDIGWDPSGWGRKRREGVYQCLEFCDILFLNDKELEGLTQAPLAKGADFLLNQGLQMIGLHYGMKGCMIYTKDAIVQVPSYKVTVKNPTGAGDVFNAAFIYGFLQRWPLEKIGQFANACAAIHLIGSSPYPSYQEVAEFMTLHEERNG
ncbi:MAG: carbohydrate kinase family protein [Candidatus Helarchaeota archaeon]